MSMTCTRLAALVEGADSTARPDPAALQEHLAKCTACGQRYPELRFLYGEARMSSSVDPLPSDPSVVTASPQRLPWVAAGIALVALGGLLLLDFASTPARTVSSSSSSSAATAMASEAEVVTEAPAQFPIEHRSEESRVQYIHSGSGVIRTTHREGTWRAPLPSVLRQK